MAQASPQLPFLSWSTVNVQTVDSSGNVSPQAIPVLQQNQTNSLIQQMQQNILSVTGQGGNGSNVHGPMSLNGNTISDITNSSPPSSSEALSYGTAQGMYQAWRQSIKTVTANYTASTSDGTILVNAAGGAVTITLPGPSGVEAYVYVVKKVDSSSNHVTVSSANTATGTAATIDGAATNVLSTQWAKAQYQSDSKNWYVVG